MAIYSIPVTLYATAYVRADSEEEALVKANEQLPNTIVDVFGHISDFWKGSFDSLAKEMGFVFSPAMTVSEGELTEAELAHD
jgi:hypothetical protein